MKSTNVQLKLKSPPFCALLKFHKIFRLSSLNSFNTRFSPRNFQKFINNKYFSFVNFFILLSRQHLWGNSDGDRVWGCENVQGCKEVTICDGGKGNSRFVNGELRNVKDFIINLSRSFYLERFRGNFKEKRARIRMKSSRILTEFTARGRSFPRYFLGNWVVAKLQKLC